MADNYRNRTLQFARSNGVLKIDGPIEENDGKVTLFDPGNPKTSMRPTGDQKATVRKWPETIKTDISNLLRSNAARRILPQDVVMSFFIKGLKQRFNNSGARGIV